MKRYLLALSLFIWKHEYSIGQQSRFSVEKRKCFLRSNTGYKLILHCDNLSKHVESFPYDYDLSYFIKQSDSIKLLIIAELLKYEKDTDICVLGISPHYFNGIEGCRSPDLTSDRFDIQIDALYIINRLCWPKLMELYSCVTALYDTVNKSDINKDIDKIDLVFDEYRSWYKGVKDKGRIPRYFPFNNGRYIWAGGRKSIATKDER
jgi:hypothetical protein